eukprot:jgi/Ulvmu1/9661/UM054_0093.1
MGLARVPSFSDRPGFPAGLRILLIEPDGQDCKAVGAQLRECSYEVCECADETEASNLILKAEQEFDLLICEASVVAHESAAWSAFVRKVKHLPLVLTGENISQQQKLLGIKFGAVDFLEKPVALLKLRNVWQHTVRKMMKQKSSASLPEADSWSAHKAHHSCRPGPAASSDKPHVESTQESTDSSQADTARPDSEMLKVKKGERKVRSTADLRATRRNTASKPLAESGTTDAPAAAPPAGRASATPAAAPPCATPAQVPIPAAQSAPTAPPAQQQSTFLYNPQGMPAPLPGCVWGLPMLPPPVPGFMPPAMMPPQPQMMMPPHQMAMPWGAQPPHSGMMPGMPMAPVAGGSAAAPGVPSPATASGCIPAPAAPCASASGSDVVMSSPRARNKPAKDGTVSVGTWSRGDASAATHLHPSPWDAEGEDVVVEDVFGLGAGGDELHDFSDSLLQADAEGRVSGKADSAAADEGLSWIQDKYLMDDFKPSEERGPFLDVVA